MNQPEETHLIKEVKIAVAEFNAIMVLSRLPCSCVE